MIDSQAEHGPILCQDMSNTHTYTFLDLQIHLFNTHTHTPRPPPNTGRPGRRRKIMLAIQDINPPISLTHEEGKKKHLQNPRDKGITRKARERERAKKGKS